MRVSADNKLPWKHVPLFDHDLVAHSLLHIIVEDPLSFCKLPKLQVIDCGVDRVSRYLVVKKHDYFCRIPYPVCYFVEGLYCKRSSNIVNHSDIYCSFDKIARFHGSSHRFREYLLGNGLPHSRFAPYAKNNA